METWTVTYDDIQIHGEAKISWRGSRYVVVGKTLPCLLTGSGGDPYSDLEYAMGVLVGALFEELGFDKAMEYLERRRARISYL